MKNINNTDFKAIARSQRSPQMKMRLLALSHFKDGKSRADIARFLKVSRGSVNKWVKIYLNEGIEGLKEKPRTGRPTYLTKEQQAQLAQYINDKAQSNEGGRLIGADIHLYIQKEFNQTYHTDSIYYLLKKMGFSWITSRSKHPKQSEQVQDDFKKIPNKNDP